VDTSCQSSLNCRRCGENRAYRGVAWTTTAHPRGADEPVEVIAVRRLRKALDIDLLDDRRQSLLGHPAWLEKARKIAACAKLGNAQLDGARPCLPIPVAIPVTLGQSEAILLAIARASLRADLHRHQLLGSKADHLAQQFGISALLNE